MFMSNWHCFAGSRKCTWFLISVFMHQLPLVESKHRVPTIDFVLYLNFLLYRKYLKETMSYFKRNVHDQNILKERLVMQTPIHTRH